MSEFDDAGWWKHAERAPLHSARVGAVINPFSIAVHSTAVIDGHRSFTGLLRRWQSLAGDENGTHFIIGRSKEQGVHQLCTIWRDARHISDVTGGFFRDLSGKVTAATLCTVGVKIHNVGQLELRNGVWRLIERDSNGTRVPIGLDVPAIEVVPDSMNPRQGYHLPTLWQLQTLQQLLAALDATLAPIGGARVVTRTEVIDAWADRANPRIVFHATLDPARKSDPWPLIGAAVNAWYP
jgi:hypothetical protein